MCDGDFKTMPIQKEHITTSPLSPGDSDSGIQLSPTPVISCENSEAPTNSNEDIKSIELLSDSVGLKRHISNEPIITIKEFSPSPSSPSYLNKDEEALLDQGYQSNMRLLLDEKPTNEDKRPLSANLMLLENLRNRPNSTSSYTFGHIEDSSMQRDHGFATFRGKLSVGSRNDRPISATPSMVAGGRRSPHIGFAGPYLTTERPLPERKVSNNIEALVEQYDKINEDDDNDGRMEKKSKSSKNDKVSVIKKKKKSKKKKENENAKGEGIEEIRLVKVAVNAFKRRRNIKGSVSAENLPSTNDKDEGNTKQSFESIVQRVMRLRLSEGVKAEDEPPPDTIPIKGAMLASSVNNRNRSPSNERRSRSHRRGSEKKVNFNDQSGRRSSSMHEAILLSRQSSIDSSNETKSGTNSKRPESVAQKILRERKHMNLKTRYLTESQAEKHLEHQRNRRRRSSSESMGKPSTPPVPLHIALKQTASKHTSRTNTANRIQQQAHIEAVKSFRIPGLESPAIRHSPMPPPKVIKSILKKNKKSYAENIHPSLPPETTHDSSDTPIGNKEELMKLASAGDLADRTRSKHKSSNGHAKKVHLNNDQHDYISDRKNMSNEENLKLNFENDSAVKLSDNVRTIQVDIH